MGFYTIFSCALFDLAVGSPQAKKYTEKRVYFLYALAYKKGPPQPGSAPQHLEDAPHSQVLRCGFLVVFKTKPPEGRLVFKILKRPK